MKNQMRYVMQFVALLFAILLLPFGVSAKSLIPMGHSIGVELQLQNVYLTNDVLLKNGTWLKAGDTIQAINSQQVKTLEEVKSLFISSSGKLMDVKLKRQQKTQHIKIMKEELEPMLSFFRDQTDGIGTLTFIDPETKEYGALGHQIIDSVVSAPPKFSSGSIFYASIEQIKKSVPGEPGYKISSIEHNAGQLGSIAENNVYGIFGKWSNTLEQGLPKPMEIMQPSEIKVGKAQLLTTIEGKKVEAFDVKITKVDDKTMQFEVTDAQLKKKTGGILQGMSGSPIIQNGRFVGAVTHMYIESPEKGAAIPLTEMLKRQPS
ncbi:SpoIVB peptidase S55 domain-containing protein [Viridibacillus sp. FSL R5-0477]|uniref:SpoIVB peptidase n=1 Tax=Viridibacillus arenosi FSL R5-213 TaxID=1227360 RepID=W4EZ56_9BACL|nr:MULTISPECIES: SpoIVB peptidase S55 domain-containing protein [Viridibacillus]ETT85352.1 SpoIVB peptidase [Viridibacillus arenosi FSL R5-213]OMC80914.1 peptidase [Viridibacillus sp. FSL H8-0123]OMC86636.1 peptidase [Viridibacillus sp. FSL H7-0596]OMC89412.1 peptidase [Viridibacillus arenosi]